MRMQTAAKTSVLLSHGEFKRAITLLLNYFSARSQFCKFSAVDWNPNFLPASDLCRVKVHSFFIVIIVVQTCSATSRVSWSLARACSRRSSLQCFSPSVAAALQWANRAPPACCGGSDVMAQCRRRAWINRPPGSGSTRMTNWSESTVVAAWASRTHAGSRCCPDQQSTCDYRKQTMYGNNAALQ